MLLFNLTLLKRVLPVGIATAFGCSAVAPTRAAKLPRLPNSLSAGALSAPTTAYLLGPRDSIRVVVKDFPEFNVDNVTIPPDGVVSMQFYGTVRVGGKTTAQVETILRGILLRELKQPRVSVTITQFRDLTIGRVYLQGAVASPGPIDIREGFRLTQIMAAIGGLNGRLEEKSATLTRAGQPPQKLDLGAALARPNSAANVRLRPDDLLSVSAVAPRIVTIVGDVAQAGTFEMHRDPHREARELGLAPRLSDAIIAAGGLGRPQAPASASDAPNSKPPGKAADNTGGTEDADAGKLGGLGVASGANYNYSGFLQRGGQRIELQVKEALEEVSGASNILLRAGDFITIALVLPPAPPAPIRVLVSGSVARVGPLQVPPGTRLVQALTEAGGLTKTADKVAASVLRGGKIIEVNLPLLLLNPDSEANIELQPDDVVQFNEPPIIRVRMAGSLANPGEMRLRPNSTLLDALLEAGGLSIKREDAQLSVLRREDDGSQKILGANAVELLGLKSVRDNIVLRDGDIVNVSALALQTVFVQGEVTNPGAFEVREGEGLVDVLTRAGGAKETAALTRILVERNGQSLSIDALDAIKSGKPLDFVMQSGDRVVVTPNPNLVAVLEAVAKPGVYAIPERGRLTLSDALVLAGGTSASTREIVLVRTLNGAVQQRSFPIKEVRGGAAGQVVLLPLDRIYVPATVAKRGVLERLGSAVGLLSIFGR